MITVLVFGTFDLMHPGHMNFLSQAREFGERLVASIARDGFVQRVKGKAPAQGEQERLKQVLASGLVDEAYLSDEKTGTYSIVERIGPDIICFGHDQDELKMNLEIWLKERELETRLYTLKPYKPHRFKTSKMQTS